MSLLDEYNELQKKKNSGQSGRKSLLQEHVESKGTAGLNEGYVNTALSNGGGFGFTQVSKAPTITISKRRSIATPDGYDASVGKNGWQKYLADREKAKIDAKAEEDAKPWWEKLLGYLGEAQDSTVPFSQMPDIIESYRNDTSYQQPNDDWTDDERYVFGYLYGQSSAKAAAYADTVNAAINEEKKAAQVQQVQESATKSGWAGAAHTAGAILTAPLGAADYLDDLAQTIARGEIRDHGTMSPFEYSQAVTGGISQNLNEKHGTLNKDIPVIGGKGWGDVYGLGTSVAQSALAAYTGGSGQALVQFFGSAAASATDDALSRGATAQQATAFGALSGTAEAVAEMVGVDNLLKIGASATMRELMINIAKQGGAEALEEGLTTLMNNVSDQLVMGDKSNFYILVQDYMDKGWSEEEAKKQAWVDMVEDIAYDMLGGFVSGAAHAAPHTAYQTVSQNAQTKKTYGDVQQDLVAEGLESAEGSLSRKLAEKYQAKLNSGGSLTGAEISRLIRANEQQFLAEDMDSIKQAAERRLVELGEFENANEVATILAKQAAKQKLTRAEKAVLQTSKYGQRVANELNPTNVQSGEFSSTWARSIGTKSINAEAYNADLMALAEETAGVTASKGGVAAPSEAGGETTTSVGGLTPQTEVPVTARSTASQTAEDVSFNSEGEAMVYSAVLDMGVSPAVAQSIAKNFDGTDSRVYVADVKLAYQYGKMNFPKSYLERLDIKPHQAEHAYNLGRSDAKAEVIQPKTKRTIKGKRGKLTFETAVDESTLTGIQRESLNGIKALAELSGIHFHVFESTKTADGYKFSLPDGTVTGANGWYVTGTNDIYIDLNAGNAGEGTMLYTAAHEISHYIKEWSPAKWRVLADFLLEQYGDDVPLEALLERQMAKIRRRPNAPTGNALMDLAHEELVADAMSEMLVDGEVVQKLSELKQKDKTLWEKIRDVIRDLLERWGLIRKEYEGRDVAGEAQFLRGMDEAFRKLQQLYTEAFVEADANYAEQTLGQAGIAVNAKTDSGSLFSVRDVLTDADRKKVAKALVDRFGVTEAEAMEWLKAETSLASLILNPKYSMYLDYEGDPNEVAIKQNSDYPQGTVDFSNICKKRREFTQVMNRVLRNFPNHVFAATDLAKIRTIMGQEGMTLPCGICYVEDRRQLDSIVAQDFIDGLKLYREGSKTRPGGKPFNANQLKGLQMTDGDTYVPTIYELITLEGRNSLKAKNPNMEAAWVRYNNARGMQSVRLLTNEAEYKRQILKYSPKTVQSKNDHGGLRIYSFSDAEMFHLIDIVQVITDSAAVGLKIQGYTKVNEYARAVRDTGEKLNRSLIPAGDLGYHMEGDKVVLDYDTVEGIDIRHEDFFDSSDNPNVGNIVIGINETQIRAAMVSDFVDMIIPFHTGQSAEVLGEKGIAAWQNYKDYQSEVDIATGKKSSHQINIYTEVIQAAEQEGNPIQNKRQFVEKFLAVCKQHGLRPRFAQFLNTDANGDYVYTEGYHKFLVDFKTFAQTEVGEYLPQMPVKPVFDNAYITGLLRAYVTEQKAKDAEVTKQMPKVIERITSEIIKPGEVKFSERDFSEQVDEVFAGTFERGNAVYVGKTPDILQQVGLNGKLPMLTTAKHILNATKPKDSWRHQHGLTEAQVKSLPEKIAAPVMVLDSRTNAQSVIVVTDMLDPDGSPVVVTIMADGRGMYNNVEIDTNFVTSYYGRDAFDGFIADNVAADSILYVNRKKATALAAESNTSWFEQLKSYDFDTIVRQTRANVKLSDRDAEATGQYADGVKFSERVTDQETLTFLNGQETITTYKTMQLVDGKLYPPMAARTEGKYEDYSILGQWEQATEHPELITDGNQYKLDKGKGQGSLKAAYNPYMHSSNLVLNDQFSGAYSRPQLVTVECEVPVSELTSGYHAQYAKDSVGWHAWHTGTVAGQLRKARGIERQVFLSRWIKPVRIVPDAEVAGMYKELLGGTDIAVPDNVVTPSLLAELKKAGVKTKVSGKVKFSDRDYLAAVESGDMETAQRMVDEAARAAGYTIEAYHGTVADFTVFDKGMQGKGIDQYGAGFYFANKRDTARGYGKNVKATYLNIKKPIRIRRTMDGGDLYEVRITQKQAYEILKRHPLMYTEESPLGDFYPEFWEVGAKDWMIRGLAKQYTTIGLLDGDIFRRFPNELHEAIHDVVGYDGVQVYFEDEDKFSVGDPDFFYVAWFDNQMKSSEPVVRDDAGEVIPLSERFNPERNDIRYSERDYHLDGVSFELIHEYSVKAPTFYSHMAKVVGDVKQTKLGAASVVNMLRGKGVKAEEIKWSGIEAWLEGKKSVTKAELQEFIAGSMLRIKETVLGGGATLLGEDGTSYESETDFKDAAYAIAEEQGIDRSRVKFVIDTDDTMEAYAYVGNPMNHILWASVLESKGASARWGQYKVKGGSNYREIVFTMPDSEYGNQAMHTHWGAGVDGVLAHARIQDMNTFIGKMLFVEEIQSDWHNAGHSEGYQTKEFRDAQRAEDEAYELYMKVRRAFNKYVRGGEFNTDPEDVRKKKFDHLRGKVDAAEKKWHNAEQKVREMVERGDGTVPDAPFRDTYHEYVMKRLLRMAAEGGYDSIGWTTADIQSQRWSDEFAEGYRIEYDQDIPKFMTKYGKKWGTRVGKTALDNGTEIWSMAITDAMQQSVLYEGQPLYSERDTDSVSHRDLLAGAFESIAQNDIERGKIAEYQKKVQQLNEQERKLAEIRKELKELSFASGARDTARITKLREEATKISNRIGIYDKQLLRLEASAPLMAVLEREKKLAYSRASQKWADRMETARTGRNKTEMRHKIKGIVSELNQLLLHGSKDKHVMIGLQKATAEALSAINMDTVAAEERLAKIQAKIDRATDPAEIAKLQQTYARIEEMGMNMNARLAALKNAYEDIKDSGDPLIAGAYQPEIEERIKNLRKMVGETPLRNMSMEQLEFTYDTYKMVLTTIRNANKAFKNAKGESIAVLGNRAMEEIETVGGKKALAMKAMKGPLSFAWSGLKPTYAFKAIGSDTLSEMFENVRAGEDTWAVDVSEAKEFYRQKTQQYHFDSWDFTKQHTFTSKTGKTFNLTLEQIMSLYAYSKRKQADAHLDRGGFVFDDAIEVVQKKHGIPVKYTVKTADAHNLSRDTLMAICGTLTDEQAKFVDEMQEYLSTTMGAKGNEVSLEMYGVKLFKEKFYFPLKSAKQYTFEQNEVAGEVKIKNSGFSKETVPHASNPVILSNFTEVWANHVNDMAMYHAFVLPLEDFNRVFNYKTPNDAKLDTESVKMYLQNAYGRQPEQYIRQLLTDLNGGARSDPNAGIINKMVGIFKKSAVFASMSVVVQQPSAIARAAAYIDTKYFVGKPSAKAWDEVKKYAPIAIIKEMGYFDTNMGVSTTEFIKAKEYHGAKAKMAALVTDSQYRDEILSKAPAVADEMAWCQIWEAVKKETAAKGLKGEEMLQAAGKRFTEVIVNTQVYDSVLSRSGMMRSKDTGVKMATAFMAEPTTSLNMITDAIIQGKRGNKKYARKAIGSVIASMILNSILVSFVYAGRDDDEDKTYAEKYVGTLTGELIDSFNPLTMIPFVKDIVSIAQGYDVERSDMAVVTDLYKAWKNLSSSNRSTYRKVEDFGGAVAAIFGLPVKNIMRDVRGMYNTVMSFVNGTKTTSFGVGEAARENLPKIVGGGERSNSDELYRAMLAGDAQHTERVKSRFKDERAVAYAIRDGLVANDARITAAAEARVAGNQSEYLRLAREITGEGHFTQDDVVRAINYVTDKLRKGETESTSSLSAPDTFKVADYYNEAVSGDQAEAALVKSEIISGMVADGKTAEEAEKSFNNSFKNSSVKPAFTEGDISVERAIAMLQNYGGLTEDAAAADVEYWAFSQNYPNIPVEDSWFDAYYKYAADVNIPVDTYMTYRNDVRGITGDGKKARRMAVIDSLPLTYEQKDALYYSEGWAASTIWEAPWH